MEIFLLVLEQVALLVESVDGISWSNSNIGYGNTISFNSVAFAGTNTYVAVGQTGKIIKATGIGTGLSSWVEYKLTNRISEANDNQLPEDIVSTYDGEFKDISYSSSKETFVAVGKTSSSNKSPIFIAVGIGTTEFLKKQNKYKKFKTQSQITVILLLQLEMVEEFIILPLMWMTGTLLIYQI